MHSNHIWVVVLQTRAIVNEVVPKVDSARESSHSVNVKSQSNDVHELGEIHTMTITITFGPNFHI